MIIKSINSFIKSLLRITLSVFMTAMIIAVVWQVFTRFVLRDPSSFTDELSRYLLIWTRVCFPGAGVREVGNRLDRVMSGESAAPLVVFSVGGK